MNDFTVATLNVSPKTTADRLVYYCTRYIHDKASVLGLQETTNRRDDALKEGLPGWTVWDHPLSDPGAQPIAFDPKVWTLVGDGSRMVTDDTFVGKEGAGPSTLRSKWIQWVTLENNRSGKEINFFNSHLVPSIYLDVRDDMHEAFIGELVRWVKRIPGRTVALGDWNATWEHPNMAPLRKVMKLGNPDGATHGNRQIDLIMHRGRLQKIDGKVLPRLVARDHRGVLVRYKFS